MEHLREAPLLDRLLALPTNIRLGGKGLTDKHSSLLRIFINYGRKNFYNIGPRSYLFCAGWAVLCAVLVLYFERHQVHLSFLALSITIKKEQDTQQTANQNSVALCWNEHK